MQAVATVTPRPRWHWQYSVFALIVGLAILGAIIGATSPAPAPVPVPDKADAVYLDPRELAAEPSAFVGRNIILQGRVLTVVQHEGPRSYTWLNLHALTRGRNSDTSIAVQVNPKDASLVKDECYRVYGVVTGSETVRRMMTGAENSVPAVRGYAWELVPASPFGCPAP